MAVGTVCVLLRSHREVTECRGEDRIPLAPRAVSVRAATRDDLGPCDGDRRAAPTVQARTGSGFAPFADPDVPMPCLRCLVTSHTFTG